MQHSKLARWNDTGEKSILFNAIQWSTEGGPITMYYQLHQSIQVLAEVHRKQKPTHHKHSFSLNKIMKGFQYSIVIRVASICECFFICSLWFLFHTDVRHLDPAGVQRDSNGWALSKLSSLDESSKGCWQRDGNKRTTEVQNGRITELCPWARYSISTLIRQGGAQWRPVLVFVVVELCSATEVM